MRVIAGLAKGKLLKSPCGKSSVRPTSDKVKAAFFNMLGARLINAKFLDLFAGTGSIGIEALSRGAQKCVFVERDPTNIKLLRENLELTMMSGYSETLCCVHDFALRFLAKKRETFHIVYLDPPYHWRELTKIFSLLRKDKLLESGGIVGVERSSLVEKKQLEVEEVPFPFQLWRRKIYGNTFLLLYLYNITPQL